MVLSRNVLSFSLGTFFAVLSFIPLLCAATTIPAPISVTPDENWDGIDGQWSSFALQLGTPAQTVRTFISTACQQTWVVLQEACMQNGKQNDTCWNDRGWTYNYTDSSTWHKQGYYILWAEGNLGYSGNGFFGYDTVALGGLGEESVTLPNTTVGGYITDDYYIGIFGINPKSTNFTSFDDPSESYMAKLWHQKLLPSVSFGYTAGAQYRFTKVLASLTLGGYDKSRFIPNNVSFIFAPDNERDLVVSIQDIRMTSATKSDVDLLPSPAQVYIDSTIPEIWLPLEACQAFEKNFGLVYDNTTDLYLVDDVLHSRLLAENANITFTLAQLLTGGPTVDITLPYAAFDLVALPPYRNLNKSSSYFPLRRAANATQYTLGRTFLQEAYLTVDWERANFSVQAVSWTLGMDTQIVPIISPTLMNTTRAADSGQNDSSKSLSTGAIIGIAIGAGLAVALVASGAVWWFWRKRHMAKKQAAIDAAGVAAVAAVKRMPSERSDRETPASPATPAANNESTVIPKAELPADSPVRHDMVNGFYGPQKSGDAGSSSPTVEADSNERRVYEMLGDVPTPLEADGRQLSEKETMMVRERRYNGVPEQPAVAPAPEEPHRRLAPVTAEDIAVVNRRGLQNVSPITPRTPRDGTYLEAEDAILSPLSPMGDSTDDSAGTSRRRFSYEC
ncbi:acid protease [Mytilinidion resinicola]|uniref:Acid protease n=1 Tax=Mytilinidion resinicola TaxID=574789 RepID=A0A6A6Z4B9_9PEZI|nr:acid protease [Mytilinidion resinicola]KAF2815926.1 acid protease [Mytilinidion resinicola]